MVTLVVALLISSTTTDAHAADRPPHAVAAGASVSRDLNTRPRGKPRQGAALRRDLAAADSCRAPDAKPIDAALKDVAKMPRVGGLFRGLAASIGVPRLDVDERVTDVTIVGGAPKTTTMQLALPAPWIGFVDVRARAGVERTCAQARVVHFDKKLARVELEGFPVDVRVNASRRGIKQGVDVTFTPARLRLAPPWLYLESDAPDGGAPRVVALMLSMTDRGGVPDPEVLGTSGAAQYVDALAALAPEIATDLKASKDPDAQSIALFEMTARLKDVSSLMPEARLAAAKELEALSVPKQYRALQKFWRDRLGPRPPKSDMQARLLIDEAVLELWVDGIKVFDADDRSPRSVGVPITKASGAQLWMVAPHPTDPRATTVHDTSAVLRPGVVYAVTRTYVALAGGGARRECVRVEGTLPSGKRLYWRELGSVTGPILGVDEAYSPPFDAAERTVGVVTAEKNAAPFPPAPLVYSYTHPGTYRWTLTAEGSVNLDLIDDEKLCATDPKDPLVKP